MNAVGVTETTPMSDWEDVEDPEGRLRKGMRVKWKHSTNPEGDMKILALCAPSGLYSRPVVPGEDWEKYAVKGRLACEKDHPEATYDPGRLMVRFRYLDGSGETTGHAKDIEEVP